MSRRGFIKAGVGSAAVSYLAGFAASPAYASPTNALLGFKPVAASAADTVVVPEGYTAKAILPWGTPLLDAAPAWLGTGKEDAAAQALQIGDNHDGMHFFPLAGRGRQPSNTEGLLAINHEYNTLLSKSLYLSLFGSPPRAAESADDVQKSINSVGASIAHIRKDRSGNWTLVANSLYNRRITAATPMAFSGPAAGTTLLRTSDDPAGMTVKGTLNNCGSGFTPWGTYLTCEENFNQNFGALEQPAPERSSVQRRYGLPSGASTFGWERHQSRFDWSKEPNEFNRFGWVVEIDPYDPNATPVKRTALGRFKHENAAVVIAPSQQVVVYMGDDEANEFIYKYVSRGRYLKGNQANNRTLLDDGTLYVARLHSSPGSADMTGTGEWIALTKDNPALAQFTDQAEILVNARLAATAVGATQMDRPEWVAVNPLSYDVYATLTNNSGRAEPGPANPRAKNIYGQIVHWREQGRNPTALKFEWDLFVLAGNPTVAENQGTLKTGSANVNATNTFNSPDGLGFDKYGRLWIETDGKYTNKGEYAHQGNNQMLCANPKTGEIRRFLVGPKECEITGISFTPDSRTLFVNIQHPGELGDSHWPEGGNALPRSATIVITKDDGGIIGT